MIKGPLSRSRGDRRAERGERVLAPHARQQEHGRVRVTVNDVDLRPRPPAPVLEAIFAQLASGVGPAEGEARVFLARERAASGYRNI